MEPPPKKKNKKRLENRLNPASVWILKLIQGSQMWAICTVARDLAQWNGTIEAGRLWFTNFRSCKQITPYHTNQIWRYGNPPCQSISLRTPQPYCFISRVHFSIGVVWKRLAWALSWEKSHARSGFVQTWGIPLILWNCDWRCLSLQHFITYPTFRLSSWMVFNISRE